MPVRVCVAGFYLVVERGARHVEEHEEQADDFARRGRFALSLRDIASVCHPPAHEAGLSCLPVVLIIPPLFLARHKDN